MAQFTPTLPQVVLLPGMQCTAAMFEPFAATLKEMLPSVQVRTRAITTGSYEEAVAEALSGLSSPAVLVGHSLGGTVAMAAARLQPRSVAGLVTICSNPRAPRPDQLDLWRPQLARATGPTRLEDEDRLVRLLVGSPEEQDVDRYTAAALLCREMIRGTAPATLVAQLTLQLARIDERPALSHFAGPIMAIGANDDLLVPPSAAREIADSARSGTATVLDAASHMAPLMRPDLVAASVARWLSDQFAYPRAAAHLDTTNRR